MTAIDQSWPGYFEHRQEGLGTTYERFVLHRLFARLQRGLSPRRVLEAPSFGMTGISGINSLWWAAAGASVTVVDDDPRRLRLAGGVWREVGLGARLVLQGDPRSLPFRGGSFDLAWNFAALQRVAGTEALLGELARVATRGVLTCLPNGAGIFQRLAGAGAPPFIGPRRLREVMAGLGWSLAEAGYLDAPPWPDIAMPKEEFLRRVGLGRLARSLGRRPSRPLCILDHFRGDGGELERRVLRYAVLEGLPAVLKRWWAHHRYFLFIPRAGR
jgi:hypothetical protein